MRVLLVGIGVLVLTVVLGSLSVDEGEIVTLTTVDDEGAERPTQLWIVEIDGRLYVRSSEPDTRWLARLRTHPDVVLERDGRELELRAIPLDDAEVREAVNRAMARKYGSTDHFYSLVFDSGESVPVLLEPAADATAQRRDPRRELNGH
jgi:hypothetical protein